MRKANTLPDIPTEVSQSVEIVYKAFQCVLESSHMHLFFRDRFSLYGIKFKLNPLTSLQSILSKNKKYPLFL